LGNLLESLLEKGADLQANQGTIFFLEFSQHNLDECSWDRNGPGARTAPFAIAMFAPRGLIGGMAPA
jgi:hypothetical protein